MAQDDEDYGSLPEDHEDSEENPRRFQDVRNIRLAGIRRALEEAEENPPPPRRGLSELIAEEENSKAVEALLLDRAIAWLEDKWVDRRCRFCHTTRWGVSLPVELLSDAAESMDPTFPVMCDNCGHTVFVNAIVAGLFEDD